MLFTLHYQKDKIILFFHIRGGSPQLSPFYGDYDSKKYSYFVPIVQETVRPRITGKGEWRNYVDSAKKTVRGRNAEKESTVISEILRKKL